MTNCFIKIINDIVRTFRPHVLHTAPTLTVLKNNSLGYLSLHAMPSEIFLTIDSEILYLVVPNEIQVALSVFQLAFQKHRRLKMEVKFLLEKLLDESFREEYLRPTQSIKYRRDNGTTIMKEGEHIAVFDKFVYHHGIYLGNCDGVAMVLDNSDTRGRDGKSIQYRTLEEFLGDRKEFVIVTCKCPENEDHVAFRSRVVLIAKYLQECDYESVQKYHLLKWNCECFAWVCATHGVKCNSDEATKLFLALLDDLSRGEKSVIGQAVVIGSHFSAANCSIM